MNRHILIMILCCAIPLGLIFLLPYMGVSLSSGALLFFIVLLCPLMHLLMMGKHGHGHGDEDEDEDHPHHEEHRRTAV